MTWHFYLEETLSVDCATIRSYNNISIVNTLHIYSLLSYGFHYHQRKTWSIHTSRCIVVLSVLYFWTIIQWCMLVSCKNQVHLCTFCHMFFKSCIGFVLSNCVNEKNAYMFTYVFKKSFWFRCYQIVWNMKYTIQHRIERSQATKSNQYNIHDTESCELCNCKC